MGNVITVEGRLGADAEMKYTANNTEYLQFNLASNSGYGDKKTTMWFRCTLWGQRAKALCQYLLKGGAVVATGTFSVNEWEDKEGNVRTSHEINCNDIWMVGSAPKSDNAGSSRRDSGQRPASNRAGGNARPTQSRQPAAPTNTGRGEQTAFDDDDIPF